MDDQASLIETLFEKTKHYTKTSAELLKLQAIDKSADVISTLTVHLVFCVFCTVVFLILNVGIALWLGEIIGRFYYGFFIVSGFYTLVGLFLYAFRDKWIKLPLRNSIIEQSLN